MSKIFRSEDVVFDEPDETSGQFSSNEIVFDKPDNEENRFSSKDIVFDKDERPLLDRMADDSIDDDIARKDREFNTPQVIGTSITGAVYTTHPKRDPEQGRMSDLASLAKEAGIDEKEIERIKSESKTSDEMRKDLVGAAKTKVERNYISGLGFNPDHVRRTGKDGDNDTFEADAEGAPAFVPQDDEGKALHERIKGYKGGTAGHYDRAMKINRDEQGRATGYSTAKSTVVEEPDGTWSVIPSVWRNHKTGQTEEAIDEEDARFRYRETEADGFSTDGNGGKVGERFGNFATREEAEAAAKDIHELHKRAYQTKWNQWINEHWDEVSETVKDAPGVRRAHDAWENAGKPGIRFSMNAGAIGGGGIGDEEWPDKEKPGMGVLEYLQRDLEERTGKKFTKGGALLYNVAPFGVRGQTIDANNRTAAREVLRSGEYNDDELDDLAKIADVASEVSDIRRMTAGERSGRMREYVSMAARDALIDETMTKEFAAAEKERKLSDWGKFGLGIVQSGISYGGEFFYGSVIAGGLVLTRAIPMAGEYGTGMLGTVRMALNEGVGAAVKRQLVSMGNSAIASIPVSVAGGVEKATGFMNKSYQMDEWNDLKVIDNNYSTLRSIFQGGGQSVVENILVESMTDEVINTGIAVGLGLLGLSKSPAAQGVIKSLRGMSNGAVKKMMGTKWGRGLLRTGLVLQKINQATNFDGMPVEFLEEEIQPIWDEVIGLAKRKDEKTMSFGEYFDKQFTWETQKDIFLGLVGTVLAHAGAAAVVDRVSPGGRKFAKDANEARSRLVDMGGIEKGKVDAMSDEDAIKASNLLDIMSANPDMAAAFAERMGARVNAIVSELAEKHGAWLGDELGKFGATPAKFTIPSTMKDGKPVPVFQHGPLKNTLTGEENECDYVIDKDTGVYITDNHKPGTDVAYSVFNPRTGKSADFMSIATARRFAQNLIQDEQLTAVKRQAKKDFIQNVWQSRYGNVSYADFNTIDEAIAYSARNGSDIVGQAERNEVNAQKAALGRGLTDEERAAAEAVGRQKLRSREAWRVNLPGGKFVVVLVRDNIKTPIRVNELFQHEIIGHNEEAMKDEFLDNLDPKIMKEAQEKLGLSDEEMDNPVARREIFANIIQRRRHDPSLMQNLTHFLKGKLGGKKVSESDIEVLAAKWEREATGDNGEAPVSGEVLEEPTIVEPEKPEEGETADETGRGADETQAQPAEGTERPAEPETLPAEAGAETGESEDVVKKPVASRTVIEKMTEQAPVKELPVSEVFNDDTRIPNFKEGANPETGEVEPLQGEPYDLVSNPIVVMEFKDGKKVVVTGRHRLALYKRAGREKIAARVIRESDGWTVNDAKMIDSIGNIIDEKGSVKDYVKYFDDARPSREAAESGGFLARPKGKLAFGIYEGATEDTRSAIDWEGGGADGMISVEQAGIIAEAAPRNGNPRNKALQRILVKKALDGLRGKKLGILARSLAEEVKNQKEPASTGGEMQLDLFSSPEDQALLAMEDKRADYRTRKSQEYGRIAEVLRTAMAKGGKLDLNEEYARELGITDPRDRNQLAVARDKAVERANYWENAVRLDEADKTAMDAEIGASAKKTETKKTEVSERLKAIKEKKLKPKAETPAQEPPKNATVSAPQKEVADTPPKAEKPVDGRKSSDTAAPNENMTAETPAKPAHDRKGRTTEKSSQVAKPRKKTVVLKDAERAKAAQSQANDLMNLFASPELDARQKQTILSGGTSLNQNPAGNNYGKKWGLFRSGTRNIDIGAGRFDKATQFLAELGVENIPFDPVNRDSATNQRAVESVRTKPADTATVHNVLNVIDNDTVMEGVINQAARAITAKGTAIFTIYEGDRSGVGRATKAGYQRNEKASSYVSFMRKYFGHVEPHGNVILAQKPKDVGPAFWAFDSTFDIGAYLASPEFDPEKFQHRVGAMAKLVSTLNKEGYNDFKSLASYLSENFQKEKFDAAKPYLRSVWNAVADAMGLEEVSKKDAEAVYTEIEKSYNAPVNEENTDVRDIQKPGRSDDGQSPSPSGVSTEGNGGGTQGQGTGQNAVQTGESGTGTTVLHDGTEGHVLHVERPEVADGAVSAGRTEGVGESAEGRPSVAQHDGRGNNADNVGTPGKQAGVALEPGRSCGVEPGGRGSVSGQDGQSVAAPVRAALNEQAPNAVKNENYIITDADERAIEGGKPKDKVRTNIAAIRIVRKLAEDGRDATPEEKTALARYVGWGGLKPAFNNTYYNAYEREQSEGTLPPQTWAAIRKTPLGEEGYDLYKQMRELLSQDEIKSIEDSTTSAFFTPIRLCRSIHRALAAAGLTDGRLLETSAGIGNFIGTGSYTNPRWTAVELDKVTGQILKALYPKANVRIQGFEDVIMPDNFMDAAISNVPFGTNHPFDPNYKKFNFLVHDFFFAKAIDKIHNGGVAALITATGTLDKRDKSLIRYLSEHGGKIVGAVRIPNGFFAKNAGTDVATDVVFIQKVNGTADNSVFLETAEYKGCPVSKYFLDHPELCMGKMVPGTNQFAQPELSYKAVDDDYSKIDEAIQKASEGLEYKSVNEMDAPQKVVLDVDVNGLKNGNIGVVDGKIVRREGEEVVEVPKSQIKGVTQPLMKRGVTPQKIVQKICELRDVMQKVIDAQMNDCTDEELARLQKDLNFAYDFIKRNYGPLHSRLVSQFVELDWAASPLLSGLETPIQEPNGVDKNGNTKYKTVGWEKNDIFSKRVIAGRASLPSSAGSVLDGLRISLNETGTVGTARIAELTGKSEDDVKKELLETGLVFVNPETSGIETRDEYLSGSVRKKLKAARAAAEIDPSFKKNVDALEQVQPDDIAATDISYQLGQNWIPRDIYEQFFKEVIFQNTSPRLTVVFDPREHLWHVDTRGYGQTEYDEESGLAIEDLLERTMNGRSIVVRRRVSENEYVVDQEATTATKIVQEKISRAFQSWMTDDTDRAERVERLYNDIMNDCVPRQYDTDVLEFYGLSKEWADRVGTKGREYQKRCIARGTFGGNLLIAHCVGAGKTFEMASICMQLRRLGIARKPMFAVPNHMLAQWNREFHEAYPGAKVLVADKKDLTKQNRRAFLARAANGDWDCIIVAHSSFSRIAMSPEHQAEYIEEELKDLNDLLFRVQSEKEKKKIRKKIQSLRDKLKSLLDPSKKDDAIKFEELGCDYLFVDEAHNFKGIQINTHMSNVPGVTGSVSQRAQDLEMKCRYISKLHGGDKGVVFATGTPISNSISEMYVMMRYLAPSKMDEMGVRSFDDWAKQFGQVVNEWSPNPSGVGFREKARFSQFQNVPEMKRFFRSFSDIVLDSELKIKRPYMIGGKPIQHVLKPSAAQIAYVQELNRRMERMQTSKVDPKEDNMLKVTTEGRLLAIDPMLIGVNDESHTRANACADEVKRIYDKSTGKTVIGRDGKEIEINGTQLIFCDSGVPKKKQFKQLVRTKSGNYQIASGYWTFTVTATDAYGNRQLYGERTDGQRITFSPVADHSIEGREDLASVYTALEALQMKAATVNAENKPGKGAKKAKKPDGEPVDINNWLDLNSDAIGYDPRFSNPYAVENEEASDSVEGEDSADDKDTSEEANGDVEVDNMLRGKFNMYAELRKQLIRRGIPDEEIAFIHDAETMTQKQALFDRVKRGEIRILIGNTAKMGEGTNVQDRLVAIHHLDIPWKPAWITQRDGRGIRSGNLNDEIGIHTYITEGTFDVYSWDTVGRKAKFIENAMNSRMDQRTIEDVDSTVMSLEEGKAAAAGDPRILERVKLIKAIEKEQMAFDTQAKALDRAQMRLRVAERDFDEAEKKIARRREIVNRYNASKGDKPFTLTTIEDEPKALTDNDALARYIQDRLGFFARKGSDSGLVGKLFGLDVRYERGQNREGVMSINELGIHFPVTVLPGTGAAFPPSDLSKFKAAVTRETGQRALDYLDDYMATYKRGVDVARRSVENAAGFDRDAAAAKIGDMNLRLAHLNRVLGIKDQNVRDIAASYLRERRGQEEVNVAAAIAASTPVEDNSVFAYVPMDARLRVAEQQMAEADFASPEFDPAASRLGITKGDLERQARNLGRVPWRPKKKTWAEVYQRSEAVLNQTGFIEELVEDAARYARPLSAEHTIAVGQHLLVIGKQYEEIRALRKDVEYSIVEASRENATTEDLASLNETLNQVKREESEISKRYATAFKAMRMSKAEQGRSLAANRALFSEEFDFLGMREVRQAALGRELTPEEMRQLHDICDRARDLDEDARAELWAAVRAQAERTIKDIFMGDSVKRAGDSRKKKLTDYRKKYLDAMAHLKVWRDTVGGSLIGITGDEYGTWNRPLFDILLWHRFQNPDITAAEALQKVTEDVNTYVTADEQTVARILTGFERSWDINRHDDVLRGGRDLRSQILTQLQIGKLLNKEMPGKTGPIPGEPSAELREARHTRDVLKSELEDETNDPRKLQGRQKRWLKWYDNRIEDLKREIAAGERLPQTKRTLAWTEEMKQKRAEYEELVNERDRVCGKSGLSEEERIKRYEAQLERTLRRATDRLLAARNDDFRRPDRPAAVTSAYIEDLKKAIEETHREWLQEKKDRLMFGRTQAEINKFNAQREKTRRDRIAYWQALTAPNADRSVVKKPQIPMPPEQQARYEELGQQMKRLRRQVMDMRAHDELMKKPWLWRHGVEYTRFVNGLTRGFLATADHSAVLRQMAQLSLGHPKLAAQVFKNTIGTAFSDEKATRINVELLSDPRIKEAVDKGWLNWRNIEAEGNSGDVEMFSSLHSAAITIGRNADGTEKRLALDDIKGVGAILRGSERIYATYINALSAEIYLALTNADGFTARLMFGQNGLTDYTKKEIAARINMANGSAQIDNGKRKQFMNQLTGIFWAPKLALSRLQLAVGWDVIHPLIDTSADVKTRLRTAGFNAIEHARSKLAMIALGTLMLMLAGDDDDKEKLRRSKWYQQFLQVIKPRIGNTTLDFSGGEVGWYQLMAKWATLQKETGTGKKVYFTEQDGHKQSFGADIMNDTFRFAQGKFNPLLSNAISIWTGKDYVGQPFGFGDLAINTFVPLGAADITKAFTENGLGRGLLLAPFVMFGAGGNTYPLKRYEIAVNQFTEVAKSYDAVRDSRDLSDDERSDMMEEIEGNFPELKQRGRIEGAIGKVKFFQSEIKKAQKAGVPVPPALTDGLEQAKSEALDYIREARKSVDSSR